MRRSSHLDVFSAIAHPVRRSLLDALTDREQPVNELARQHSVSRPAISQHLRILLEAGLVEVHPRGRRNSYRLRPDKLEEAYSWLAKYQRFWGGRLGRLGAYLDNEAAKQAAGRNQE
jgi:DNA-binding transcriptional ArsR family regulator